MLIVNGEEKNIAGMTLGEYLRGEGRDPVRIAVMINESIVPKSSYDTTVLADGDIVEVVGFVGGG